MPRTFSGKIFAEIGLLEPDVELAKADLATRVYRLTENRRLTSDQAAALLRVRPTDLPALFQGRLATCSLDQLLRILTWLGDDVEILIRPRLQRTKRGALRVLQAAAVEKPDDFEPVRVHRKRSMKASTPKASTDEDGASGASGRRASEDERLLLDKHDVEKVTSLDITTIYRKMSAGTFPQPLRVGRRRVAWRASDITRWQQDLEIGTQRLRWKVRRYEEGTSKAGVGRRDGR